MMQIILENNSRMIEYALKILSCLEVLYNGEYSYKIKIKRHENYVGLLAPFFPIKLLWM